MFTEGKVTEFKQWRIPVTASIHCGVRTIIDVVI